MVLRLFFVMQCFYGALFFYTITRDWLGGEKQGQQEQEARAVWWVASPACRRTTSVRAAGSRRGIADEDRLCDTTALVQWPVVHHHHYDHHRAYLTAASARERNICSTLMSFFALASKKGRPFASAKA